MYFWRILTSSPQSVMIHFCFCCKSCCPSRCSCECCALFDLTWSEHYFKYFYMTYHKSNCILNEGTPLQLWVLSRTSTVITPPPSFTLPASLCLSTEVSGVTWKYPPSWRCSQAPIWTSPDRPRKKVTLIVQPAHVVVTENVCRHYVLPLFLILHSVRTQVKTQIWF